MNNFSILPLGGCLLEGPLNAYARHHDDIRAVVGQGSPTPVLHTLGDMAQFIGFIRSEIHIPPEIKPLVGIGPEFQPLSSASDLKGVDVVLVEPNTPIEIVYRSFSLQRNAIIKLILDPIRARHPEPGVAKLVSFWYAKGLLEANDVMCATHGPALADLMPTDSPIYSLARDVLVHARGVQGKFLESFHQLRAAIDRPIGVLTYIYQYMPDGRPISWPRGFRQDVLHAAQLLGLPLFEPWTLVEKFGVAEALRDDLRHYREEFMLFVADALIDFGREVALQSARSMEDTAVEQIDGFCTPALPNERSHPDKPTGKCELNAAPSTLSVSPSQLAERLNTELCALHSERAATLGVNESGLFQQYLIRVEKNALVSVSERAVFERIDAWLPRYDGYAVLKAGLGELALLLAASGRRTVAYETHRLRRAAILAGMDRLESLGLMPPGMLSVEDGLMPAAGSGERVLGVGLDVLAFRDEEAASSALENLVAFDGLLIDLRTFLFLRDTPEDRDKFSQKIQATSLTHRFDFPWTTLSWFSRHDPKFAALDGR